MGYENLLAGSPLIPAEVYVYYGIAATIFFIFLLLNKEKIYFATLVVSFRVFHAVLLLIIIFLAFVVLRPIPKVINTEIFPFATEDKRAIEITFNRPVMRKNLKKSISPPSPGFWLFKDPIYDTHLYRKVVFYPYDKFYPGTNYTVTLSGISNFLNEKQTNYNFSFKAPHEFNVLGEATKADSKDELFVKGSFPANGWNGINVDTTIRIGFNQPIDKKSAQSKFSISPSVSGTFYWEGDILIAKPSNNLEYNKIYTYSISAGTVSLSGKILNKSYSASFTTQPEITKLNIAPYLQKYSLSCEAATLRMALMWRGVDVSEDELLAKIGFDPNGKRENIWGNPYVGFVGNVKGKQMINGYGVYWEPIARAANNYRYAKSFENWTVTKLTESIQKSTPVIVWISIKGQTPTVWTTPSGDRIKAVSDEHTVLVVGYTGSPNNPSRIIVNDPLIGETYWTTESFLKKWNSFSNSGVLVF